MEWCVAIVSDLEVSCGLASVSVCEVGCVTTVAHCDVPEAMCKDDCLLSIVVDSVVYCTSADGSWWSEFVRLASLEELLFDEAVGCCDRYWSRSADLSDGMCEPAKCNGEPIANAVSAEYGVLASGAAYVLVSDEIVSVACGWVSSAECGGWLALLAVLCVDGTLCAIVSWLYGRSCSDVVSVRSGVYESSVVGLVSKPTCAVIGEVDAHSWSGLISERDIVVG